MKKYLRVLISSAIFCLLFNFSFGQYTLTVTNGYGGGTFNAGDTVDVWSSAIPVNNVFDKWTGDVFYLESNDEWHTTLIMPSQNVSITANFRNIGAYTINHESITGRDTMKEVYSYFPPNFKGVIFCFHGMGGAAANWVNLWEYKEFLNDAVADTFGFIITEAEEITKQTDIDHDGKLRWSYTPYDSVTNIDLANIKILIDTFHLRGITTGSAKYYAVGMSNGGAFSPEVATLYNWKAAVSYCAPQSQLLVGTTHVPIQWCMQKYDNNANVGPQGNADALADYNTMVSRGICSNYFLHDHSPVYPERFMRSGTITQTKANNFFAELQSHNLLDANNYLLYASDTIAARIIAAPLTFPTFLSLSSIEKIFVSTQVDAMYAAHQFYSDYNKKTLRFFDSLCDTGGAPTAVEEIGNLKLEIILSPNPTSGNLNISFAEAMIGEEFLIVDVCGRILVKPRITSSTIHLSTSHLAAGIYFVVMKNMVKKFIKE